MAPPPEPASSLQVAQILADLQTLHYADISAARNFLAANKNICPLKIHKKALVGSTPEAPKFDRLGRRIVPSPSSSAGSTPKRPAPTPLPGPSKEIRALSNSNMGFYRGRSGWSHSGSGLGQPPPGSSFFEEDEDMKRAKLLLELVDMKNKIKNGGDFGLTTAKVRLDYILTEEVELAKRRGSIGIHPSRN